MMNRLRVTMANTSWTILRQLRRQGNGNPGFCRCLNMTSHRPQASGSVGKDDPLDHLKENPFYKKYSTKLKHKQILDPEEFSSKVTELEEEKKRAADELKKQIAEEQTKRKQKKLDLDSLMKVDLIRDKSAEEIEAIWTEYHKEKDVIFAVVPVAEYEQIMERAREFATFLYPLPREDGYEFFVQQFDGNQIHFMPLIEFQTRGENATTCLTVTHYTELQADKGIVLMRGEPDTKILSVHEAQLLALQVKMYYGLRSGLKFNLVRLMNNSPQQFRHMDLVKEFENFKKDHKSAKDNKHS